MGTDIERGTEKQRHTHTENTIRSGNQFFNDYTYRLRKNINILYNLNKMIHFTYLSLMLLLTFKC